LEIRGTTWAARPLGAGLWLREIGGGSPPALGGPRLALRAFASSVRELGDTLAELRRAGKHRDSAARGRGASAVSSMDLGLGSTPSAARMRSTEQVNAAPTSYSTSEPRWLGSSSAAVMIGGVYDGSNGDTTLTFTATVGGTISSGAVRLEVTDGAGRVIDTLGVGSGQAGQAQTLSNGLELSFRNGNVRTGDSFEVEVSASVGAAVNPYGRFNATGLNGPNFEPGVSVSTGAFWINGQRINVSAAATIHGVLASITASDAGVTATWDDDEEKVVLTLDTPGTGGSIEITGDTSGFVAAVKLTGATLEVGASNDSQKNIGDVDALADIASGDFTINGVTFQVDRANDSLSDLIRAINASEAGVNAYFDPTSGKLAVRALGAQSLVLDDGTSGLFGALGIAEGVYRGSRAARSVSLANPGALRRELRELTQSLGKVLQGDVEGYAAGAAAVIRESLVKELEAAFEDVLDKTGNEQLRSGLGLDLGTKTGSLRTLVIDESALGRALRRDEEELVDLLFAERREDGRAGLLERLDGVLERAYTQLAGMLAPEEALGLRLDVSG
jgi:flagellar capping protein FliD